MAPNKSQLIVVGDGNDANGDGGIDYADSICATATGFAPASLFAVHQHQTQPEFRSCRRSILRSDFIESILTCCP